MESSQIRVSLKSRDWGPYERGEGDLDTKTCREEGWVKTVTAGVMWPPAPEHQGMLAAQRSTVVPCGSMAY